MSLTKNSILQRRSELTIKLAAGGTTRIDFAEGSFSGDHNTLRILDAFSKPTRLDEAIAALKIWTPSYPAFREMMGQVMSLIEAGIIADAAVPTKAKLGTKNADYGSLPVHIRMLDDRRRTEAFQDAIHKTVKPSDVVVDLGTGTGILAITAAQAGAKHVYAIERNSGTAQLARQMIGANGLESRISVVEGSSFQVTLPQPADVLVSEMLGNEPLAEDLRLTTEDAVKRFLTPDARLIPECIRIYGLPMSVPPSARRGTVVGPSVARRWYRRYGVDFTPLAEASGEQDHRIRVNPYNTRKWPRLSQALLLAELDLYRGFASEIATTQTVAVARTGLLTGILVYFDAQMSPDCWFSISPDAASASNHWGSFVWLPGRPINLEKGKNFSVVYKYRDGESGFKIQPADKR